MVDEKRIDIEWDKFIDVLTEECQEGCDDASDEFLLGIIRNKIQQSYPESYNLDEESLTIGEVRKLFGDMYNNLPSDNSELIKTAKGMVKEIDDRQDYVSRRLRELSVMLANYEDSLEITEEGIDKNKVLLAVEIGRAKIDELNRLKKELKNGN